MRASATASVTAALSLAGQYCSVIDCQTTVSTSSAGGSASWAASQEAANEDDKELIIRVSRAAKEVTAGYEVDELQAAIAIKAPPAYPLEGVSVEGVNRVAVNEKKWQSWIMATQGVITFSVRFMRRASWAV